jgi:hypothetical protein
MTVLTAKSSAKETIARLERLSTLHMQVCVDPLWEAYPDFMTDPWDSLRIFLRGYAFEHQGRSPDYGPVAVAAVDSVKARPPGSEAALAAWLNFGANLSDRGRNVALNPLCPGGTEYAHKNRAPCQTRKLSIIEFAASCADGIPLIAWARDKLRADATEEAHTALCTINGIGPKKASLFLRDVAVHFGLSCNRSKSLLQPIDVWVRRAAAPDPHPLGGGSGGHCRTSSSSPASNSV